jgi:hypothetical protein
MAIERCTKLHVLTVETNAKFHLNQRKAEMFIVENVIETIEDINSIFSKF